MEDILKAVEQFIKDKHSKKEWIAGRDLVQYAGDYFDEKEYVAAVKTLLNHRNPHLLYHQARTGTIIYVHYTYFFFFHEISFVESNDVLINVNSFTKKGFF